MKPIERAEVLGIADYETIRERFRARVIAEKKLRRVKLGDKASAVFENRDTMLLQIQEMLRTERITREAAVQHEIDTYNQLVPGDNELSCTIMIEIDDKAERDDFLRDAAGFEKKISLRVGGEIIKAITEERSELADRTTAVHYVKFKLSEKAAGTLRRGAKSNDTIAQAVLEVDHPVYQARTVLPVETIVKLGEDLET
jgi:hypothetical protein